MICKISEFIKISVQPDLSQGIRAAQDIAQPEQEQPQGSTINSEALLQLIPAISKLKKAGKGRRRKDSSVYYKK